MRGLTLTFPTHLFKTTNCIMLNDVKIYINDNVSKGYSLATVEK